MDVNSWKQGANSSTLLLIGVPDANNNYELVSFINCSYKELPLALSSLIDLNKF